LNHYFTAEAATAIDVIFAYRGDDTKNSLPQPAPPDAEAQGSLSLPGAMPKKAVEQFLAQSFVNLAVANPGHRILIRLSDQNVVTYWMVPLSA
jgi:hypothetical protein